MKYGFIMPSGDARDAAELAVIAEHAGWDGFFIWEGIWAVDAWVSLTAAAMRTRRIRLGTMLTPLPRRLPWEVASQTATLDRLCGGRVVLSVGLGAPDDRFWIFEDDPGRKVRAQRLDEALDMIELMWRGEPFTYQGAHFRARRTEVMIPPPAAQRPRIPIWVVGAWPRLRSMRRAARFDGWLPNYLPSDHVLGPFEQRAEFTPKVAQEAVAWIREERARQGLADRPYDVVIEGTTNPGDPESVGAVRSWAEAGATWWLEADWSVEAAQARDYAEARLTAGPPRV